MGVLSPKAPAVPAPPPTPKKPKDIDAKSQAARKSTEKKAKAAFGSKSTILTSSLGVTGQAQTAGKTALGS